MDESNRVAFDKTSQLDQMKRNAKVRAFTECNEERIAYLNECMRLHKMLKMMQDPHKKGGEFKGIRVTQSVGMSPQGTKKMLNLR